MIAHNTHKHTHTHTQTQTHTNTHTQTHTHTNTHNYTVKNQIRYTELKIFCHRLFTHSTSVYDRKVQFGTPNLLYIVSGRNHLQSVIFFKIF